MAFVCTIASGSDGNCALISHGGTHLLVDAGLSAKRIRESLWHWGLSPEDIRCVLVTHEHGDHIGGLGVLRRPVMATEQTARALLERFPALETAELVPGRPFRVGAIEATPFSTPHDTPGSVGFSFQMDDRRVCLCTDLGHVTRDVAEQAENAHCLLLESNHDETMLRRGPYPESLKRRILGPRGHLSNRAAAELVVRAVHKGTECVMLMHLSKDNNRPELALETIGDSLRRQGVEPGRDLRLEAAPHRQIGIPWGKFA